MTSLSALRPPSGEASRIGDLILVGLSVVVIALMVLPMPAALLDLLIAINIGSAIGLLLYSIYISSPVAFSTFPSLLLITTLLRIAINVATTRRILLHADGGDIIATFGKLVVGGSLAVGLVVFIIITVIQFIVIAKGAERVAEVIARFTLDAIPGKQMSIDSDLRAGLITEETARARRAAVENESRFFGAMDGAMKFVKGDAIAGIVIILVNLLGGLAIGILVHHLDAGVAVQRYSVLSVGEGLAAQIPALFIALAAGIIVTRSSSGEAAPLAGSITSQIVSQPRALVFSGIVMMLFCLVPGFPKLTFALLGLALAVFGAVVLARRRKTVDATSPGVASMAREGSPELHPIIDAGVPPAFATLAIEIAPESVPLLSREQLDHALLQLRRELSRGLGLPFPGVRLRLNPQLPLGGYGIRVLEVPTTGGALRPHCALAFTDPARLAAAGIEHHTEPPCFVGPGTAWVPQAQVAQLARLPGSGNEAPIAVWNPADVIIHHLAAVIELHPHRLLGLQDTQALLQAAGKEYPDLVRETLKVVPLPRMTRLFKALVSEGISLRFIRDILQAALEHGGAEKDDEIVVERIRGALSAAITHRYAGHGRQLPALVIEPSTEDLLRQAVTMGAGGIALTLPPNQAGTLIDAIKDALLQPPPGIPRDRLPLLAAADVRRPLRKLLETDLPWLPVIAHSEVSPGVTVQTVAVIRGSAS